MHSFTDASINPKAITKPHPLNGGRQLGCARENFHEGQITKAAPTDASTQLITEGRTDLGATALLLRRSLMFVKGVRFVTPRLHAHMLTPWGNLSH